MADSRRTQQIEGKNTVLLESKLISILSKSVCKWPNNSQPLQFSLHRSYRAWPSPRKKIQPRQSIGACPANAQATPSPVSGSPWL